MSNMYESPTDYELQLIRSVVDGADIYDRRRACEFRDINRKFPGILSIEDAREYDGDGTDVMPYFGVVTTDEGDMLLARIDKAKEKRSMK